MGKNEETEIKLIIKSPKEVAKKLQEAGAQELGVLEQEDIIWDYAQEGKSFEDKKQSFRLRRQKGKDKEVAILTFKKASRLDESGIKTRKEYNVQLDSFDAMKSTLENVGFIKSLVVRKKRRVFKLGNLEITLDQLPFGNYLEIEGDEKEIKQALKKLGFDKYRAETRPYFIIQQELESAT